MIQNTLEEVLAEARTRFDVSFEQMDVDGTPLEVLSVRNMTQYLDNLLARRAIRDPLKDLPLWAKVWPASFVLGRYLRKLEPEGKTLLEIGAGCGITGCIAARYGFSRVIVSDALEDALLFARANILQNNLAERVDVRLVDVTTARLEERFDVLAASEILYLEELHRPLIKFVARHLASGGKAVFCTDLARRQKHFFKLAAHEFSVAEHLIGVRSKSEDGTEERRVYAIHTLEFK